MTINRNTEGLRQNAQKKRQEALDKVEQGIRQLLKEGRAINFNTVAQVADVSKAFLYKEPEIKERIEQLRQQGTKKTPELKQKASDTSKDAMIRTLRDRIKKLEQHNRNLSQQNEVFAGQVLRVCELERQLARLQAENATLRLSAGIPIENSIVASSEIEAELVHLGVDLNSTIRNLLRDAPESIIRAAIKALKEATLENRVENPSGFFNRAVTGTWKPNQAYEQKVEVDLFKEWFPLAHRAGLVQASTLIDGVQHVLDAQNEWVLFELMLDQYPIYTMYEKSEVPSS